ncbi:lipase domain-containing protein [Phthorimaea operculella]|nr:lipase domain-containing protein [Phthorimaea operculella]
MSESGLDPARPLVSAYGSRLFRLGRDDAHVVQVIHTNAGFLGETGLVGHADFCVNGGRLQPGCHGHLMHRLKDSHVVQVIHTNAGFLGETGLVGRVNGGRLQPGCRGHVMHRLKDSHVVQLIHTNAGFLGETGLVGRVNGGRLQPGCRGHVMRRDDAHVVQVIHTNAGFLGETGLVGHADFCVNGGRLQPGCHGHLMRVARCSHFMSSCYFAASVRRKKHVKIVGVPCDTTCPKTNRWGIRPGRAMPIGEETPDHARGMYCVSLDHEEVCPFD